MTSDSSRSTTPMVLTPDSTGGSPDSSGSSVAAKKARRQTAFYPNINSSNKPNKPFSRSAAKRESVMTLGSIEHLQHYFTKTGIIKPKKGPSEKLQSGLVPAIGGLAHLHINPAPSDVPAFQLPPSPAIPQPIRPAFPPFVKSYETDPESLLPGVIDDLIAVSHAWNLDAASSSPDLLKVDASSSTAFDVLGVLQTTTRAIRSVRNYLLSLPDESTGTIRAQFRSKVLGPGISRNTPSQQQSSTPDPLTLIRRSALEVLTVLRELEERCRLPLSDDAYDAQSDGGHSRGGTASRMASPSNASEELPSEDAEEPMDGDTSVAFSLVQVQGRYESVAVWEDEDGTGFTDEEEEKEKRDIWDERLVLGGGWLYNQDVRLEELEKERKAVGVYLDAVDEVLFHGKKAENGEERGWERERRKMLQKGRGLKSKRRRTSAGDAEGKGLGIFLNSGDGGQRRVSTGMVDIMNSMTLSEEPEGMEGISEEAEEGEESVDDDDLPEWARRSTFPENDLNRAHALLVTLLPSHLISALSSASSKTSFLESLSSGQLLCIAYNSGVRKSKKPWGYVSKDGIHDILALERAETESAAETGETRRKGWTFRRTDNLRLWVGALKLRYMLPIVVPSQALPKEQGSSTPLSSPLPSNQRFPTSESPLMFDAKIVARKDVGWEDMLEAVILRWVHKVVEERRMER